MAQVKSINLNFDDGSVTTVSVGPQQIEIDTPWGKRSFAPKPPGPTVHEVAANPGKFDGTDYDPMEFFPPTFWDGELITPVTGEKWNWATMFKKYPEEAMSFMKGQLQQAGNAGFEKSFKSNLSINQRMKMGLMN